MYDADFYLVESPLAEGRELKFVHALQCFTGGRSPLAEGRELKFGAFQPCLTTSVAPRGGA